MYLRFLLSNETKKMSEPMAFTGTPREYEIGDNDFLVLVSDKASHFIYANPAYCKASGYAWEELKGTITASMMHKDTPVQVSMDMVATLRLKQPWTGIIKNKRKNGDYYWLRLNISPLYAKNNQYAGALLVHSKVSKEEVRRIEPIYKMMNNGQNKNLVLRHGKPVRLNAWTKALLWWKSTGIQGLVWAGMLAATVAMATALAVVSESLGLKFWATLAGFAAFTGGLGAYLVSVIVAPLRQAVRFANNTAAGDLTAQMQSERSDEIGALIRALAQMNMNMRATVVDVRDGVGVMKQATDNIADGTSDLSQRTNMQATHLETTAASMEEMTATVKQTADASKQANACATSARAAAESGGKVISEVIATMAGITQSSKKIAEIIGVIDSIAFQTNILALNAAVEAARAGEQGKGFAVVAGEVRNLAKRSAMSAREIRELIFESVDKVASGSKLVDTAGKTMSDVLTQMRQVTDLVSRIANSSLEQSAGISQINDGVTNLDEVTQQNVQMVTESTASAESLRAQAEQLTAAVSVFKLSQQENLALYNSTRITSEEMRNKTLVTRAA
jgi:aerotaxis receptor